MKNRPWDPEGKYKNGYLKSYNNWTLELSFRQHTLGCYVIFSNRNVEKTSDLNADELIELGSVMRVIESALLNIDNFKPDRFNYLQLGNGLHRLHFHGVPRYKSNREFRGEVWLDNSWGKPPVWSPKDVSSDLIIELKKIILEKI